MIRTLATQLLLLALGLVVLTAGAVLLVRGGASVARRLGLSPLVIGLTVVAFGTSAPEMIVSVAGAANGQGDIALGNVVGSNIFNVGVILALAALISPIHVKLDLLKVDAPFMIVVSLLAVWLAHFETITRSAGVLLLVLLVGYTVFSVWMARKQGEAPELVQEFESAIPSRLRSVSAEIVLVVLGLGLLILGSELFIGSAVTVARALGVGEAAIGLTIVAAGTSMPELATSAVAAIRGQSDIAIGNVIGSNIFNILGTLGLAATVRPLSAPGIDSFDLWVMIAFAVALVPLLWTGRRLQRLEGGLLLAGYAGYVWSVWPG